MLCQPQAQSPAASGHLRRQPAWGVQHGAACRHMGDTPCMRPLEVCTYNCAWHQGRLQFA